MMIYALGAMELMRERGLPRPQTVRMTIVQPRIDNTDTWEVPARTLEAWRAETLEPRIREALGGYSRAQAGDWCRFCRVRPECRELAAYCLGSADAFPVPGEVGADELGGAILPRLSALKTWAADMEARALGLAMSGTRVPGWKVVEGRSVRRFTDAKAPGKPTLVEDGDPRPPYRGADEFAGIVIDD